MAGLEDLDDKEGGVDGTGDPSPAQADGQGLGGKRKPSTDLGSFAFSDPSLQGQQGDGWRET